MRKEELEFGIGLAFCLIVGGFVIGGANGVVVSVVMVVLLWGLAIREQLSELIPE